MKNDSKKLIEKNFFLKKALKVLRMSESVFGRDFQTSWWKLVPVVWDENVAFYLSLTLDIVFEIRVQLINFYILQFLTEFFSNLQRWRTMSRVIAANYFKFFRPSFHHEMRISKFRNRISTCCFRPGKTKKKKNTI